MATKEDLNGGTGWLDTVSEENRDNNAGNTPPSGERLAGTEASLKALWKWQAMVVTFVSLLFIISTAWTTWQLTSLASRIETMDQKIDAIPDRLTEIANAIANNITATKQPAPIVIYATPRQEPPSNAPKGGD